MMEILLAAWAVTLELAPWLLLGSAVSGAMHIMLPSNFMSRYLRGRGGVYRAVLLGVPLPLCSCGVIPTGIGLKRDGASDGASVGFLIATPQTGVDSLFVTASMLGWPFAVFKLVSASVTGLVGGLWVDKTNPSPTEAVSAMPVKPQDRGLGAGLEHAVDVLRSIWRWLVFGILVSACLTVFVPVGSFNDLSSLGPLAVAAITLAFSVPLYVCAVASVPIAATLVASGFPPSAALIFLMAGPATNVATMGVIGRTFGRNNLVIYLVTIIVGSVAFGQLLDLTWASEVNCTHCFGTTGTPIELWSSTLLLGLLTFFGWEDLQRFYNERRNQRAAHQTVKLPIDGMTCNGCARKLENALKTLPGIDFCSVSKEQDVAQLKTSLPIDTIEAAVVAAGFSIATTNDRPSDAGE
ncbi:MAG: permease [Myxococcota bacterium]|nr:permease [Myxococcota bacterium]